MNVELHLQHARRLVEITRQAWLAATDALALLEQEQPSTLGGTPQVQRRAESVGGLQPRPLGQ